jgi:hypothetical protein
VCQRCYCQATMQKLPAGGGDNRYYALANEDLTYSPKPTSQIKSGNG